MPFPTTLEIQPSDLEVINSEVVTYLRSYSSADSQKIFSYQKFLEQEILKKITEEMKNYPNKEALKKFGAQHSKCLARVIAAPLAISGTTCTVGIITPPIATLINSSVKTAIQSSFNSITDINFITSLISPLTNALSTTLGNTAGLALGVALPLAGLYFFVPILFKFFSKFLRKSIKKLCKNNETDHLNYFPTEGPLFDFICNLSTLFIVDKLVVELKLKGIEKISFNFDKLKSKLSKSETTLNHEEQVLYKLAQINAEKLIKISKKAQSRQKLSEYKKLETTVRFVDEIKLFTGKIININLNNEINFFITVLAVFLDKEEQPSKLTFFNKLHTLSMEHKKEKGNYFDLEKLQNNTLIHNYREFRDTDFYHKEGNSSNKPLQRKKIKIPITSTF